MPDARPPFRAPHGAPPEAVYNLACFGHMRHGVMVCVVAADSGVTVSGLCRADLRCVVTRVCTILRGGAVRVALFNKLLSSFAKRNV